MNKRTGWGVRGLCLSGAAVLVAWLTAPGNAFALQTKFTGGNPVTLAGQKPPPKPKVVATKTPTKGGKTTATKSGGSLLDNPTLNGGTQPAAGGKTATAKSGGSLLDNPTLSGGDAGAEPAAGGDEPTTASYVPPPVAVAAAPGGIKVDPAWLAYTYDSAKTSGKPALIVVFDATAAAKGDKQADVKSEKDQGGALSDDDQAALEKELADLQAKIKALSQQRRE